LKFSIRSITVIYRVRKGSVNQLAVFHCSIFYR